MVLADTSTIGWLIGKVQLSPDACGAARDAGEGGSGLETAAIAAKVAADLGRPAVESALRCCLAPCESTKLGVHR